MRTLFIGLVILLVMPAAYAEESSPVFTTGFDHVGLSVSDLESSTVFFTQTLGWSLRGRDVDYPATFVTDGNMLITLWQVSNPDQSIAFDRKNNVGLHHLAISVSSFAALNSLHRRFQQLPNVKIEFAPELASGGPAKNMMIREPSGNRLEFRHTPER